MRVVFSAGTALGLGGLGSTAYQIARSLQETGDLDKVICTGSRIPDISPDKIKIINLKWLPKIFHYSLLRRRVDLLTLIHDNLFDFWASHEVIGAYDLFCGITQCSLYSMKKAKAKGMRVILHSANSHIANLFELLEEEGTIYGLRHSFLHKRMNLKVMEEYEEADYIRVLSKYAYRSFIDRGVDKNKLVVIPLGIDLRSFYPREKKDDFFRICFVGSFSLRKGFQYLLQALDELKIENYELIMVGGSGDRVCKNLILHFKKKLNMVCYAGDPVPAYSKSSLFVLPSIEDGWGLVVLEAMACGLPVIITENTGAKDAVREGIDGFIIPIRDVEALKERIKFLYDNESIRREMGKSAAIQAKKYGLDNVTTQLVHFYEKVKSDIIDERDGSRKNYPEN